MKKFAFFACAALAVLFFCQAAPAEARGHHHHHCHHHRGTRVQFNLGGGCGLQQNYVVRRYAAPVVPVAYVPVTPYAAPVYVPTYQPYVEEVYSQPVVCNPLSLMGLSLSWNFSR